MEKQLPIGYDSFEKIISQNLYYVDKTLMIKELLDKKSHVNLFTRPRRFGKTLILSMLRAFFEKDYDEVGGELVHSGLFSGLKIMEAGEEYTHEMGKYPIISISLKSAKQPDFEMAYASLIDELSKEYQRHAYVLKSDKIIDSDKKRFSRVMDKNAEAIEYAKALEFLSACLTKVHGQNTIILIDEYDVPLENAYFCGFYKEMIDFISSLFESALKTNENLKFAVITGCLRISKESIFIGLNNLEVHSLLKQDYAEYFGFTKVEIEKMLEDYGLSHKQKELQEWYDGYLFGKTEVYNPWSVINFVNAAKTDITAHPRPYWSNTSSNNIVRELIVRADDNVKQEIEGLLVGGVVEKPIHEDITYEDVYKTQDNLWNFLLFTGYLKKQSERFEDDRIYFTMAIPNAEIKYIYRNTILEWFDNKIENTDLSELYRAFQEKNGEIIEDMITNQLVETISFYDYAENYYHGFLCGLLKACSGFVTLSNRESGNGRPDIILKTSSVRGMAIIMELKVVKDFEEMEAGCLQALEQIEEKQYEAALYKEGYRKILKYGICFYRKECMVKVQ